MTAGSIRVPTRKREMDTHLGSKATFEEAPFTKVHERLNRLKYLDAEPLASISGHRWMLPSDNGQYHQETKQQVLVRVFPGHRRAPAEKIYRRDQSQKALGDCAPLRNGRPAETETAESQRNTFGVIPRDLRRDCSGCQRQRIFEKLVGH